MGGLASGSDAAERLGRACGMQLAKLALHTAGLV
jgi:hypothetical protein